MTRKDRSKLVEAIRGNHPITFTYKGLVRKVEPHAFGKAKTRLNTKRVNQLVEGAKETIKDLN